MSSALHGCSGAAFGRRAAYTNARRERNDAWPNRSTRSAAVAPAKAIALGMSERATRCSRRPVDCRRWAERAAACHSGHDVLLSARSESSQTRNSWKCVRTESPVEGVAGAELWCCACMRGAQSEGRPKRTLERLRVEGPRREQDRQRHQPHRPRVQQEVAGLVGVEPVRDAEHDQLEGEEEVRARVPVVA